MTRPRAFNTPQLSEIPSNGKDQEVLLDKKRLESECDVIAFLYDSADPNSFQYVANLQVRALIGPLVAWHE
jgi:hypothetical protein